MPTSKETISVFSDQTSCKRRRSPYGDSKDSGSVGIRDSVTNGSEGSLPNGRRLNTIRESLLTVLGKLVVWRGTRYTATTLSQPEILRGILSVRKYEKPVVFPIPFNTSVLIIGKRLGPRLTRQESQETRDMFSIFYD